DEVPGQSDVLKESKPPVLSAMDWINLRDLARLRRPYAVLLVLLAALAAPGPGQAQKLAEKDPESDNPSPIQVPPPALPPPYMPFPQFPPVRMDEANDRIGIAQQTARSKKLQARILWIDATANLNRINTAEKIAAVVDKIRTTGFNTI